MKKCDVIILDEALEFLQKLPLKMHAKAYRTIELLEEFGPYLPMPHAKALKGTGGLRELRVKQARDIVRLFYFHHDGKVFVVTSGFVKKSDRTSPRQLDRAVEIMKGYKGKHR